ncbi:MAG: nuclear transport factor 2 family protein [Candidatus Rokuibacteriota bacterium]
MGNAVETRLARASDVQKLEQLNRDYVRAAQASNVRWFDANLAACFMGSNPDGSLVDRAGFLDRIGRPNPSTNMAAVGTHTRIVGDIGIIDSGFRFTRPDGQEGVGHYTDVYGFVDGRWQCISAHFALRPAPPQTGATRTAAVAAGAASRADHAALADLNHHYIRSVQESDVRWFEANLAPEFVNGDPAGTFSDRAAFIAAIGKPSVVSNLREEDVRIQVVADIGIIHARTAYSKPDGQNGTGRYTDIWWRAADQWRCVSAHVTRG